METKQSPSKSKTTALLVVLLALLIASTGYIAISSYTAQISHSPGFVDTYSYLIWAEGTSYYAKNGSTGVVDYAGTNFTDVFQETLASLPSDGGIIHLKPGSYDGWMIIDRDGVIVEGEGAFTSTPAGLPDDPPANLTGTILKVTAPGMDAIHIRGQRNGIHIRDLGIWFTQPITGEGISDDTDQNYHLSYCTFENIKILDTDRNHYALQMSNFVQLEFRQITSWGGPLIHLSCNRHDFASGNSDFYSLYGYVKEDIDYPSGTYPIFIHGNDSSDNAWINLLHFYRIQINTVPQYPGAQFRNDSAYGYYTMMLMNCRYSTFNGLDLEGVDGNKLKMESCNNVEFNNAYIWSHTNNLYINISSSNDANVFIGCRVTNGTVLDSCKSDVWIGCSIDGTIDNNSKAQFIPLPTP